MANQESLEQALNLAQRVLATLEEQAAGYTSLTIPAHLKIELEEKRKEVASLEARLRQLKGQRNVSIPDNVPRRPDIFVGREEQIRRCLAALSPEDRGWGVTIDGIGGIGKTALALEVAHRARDRAEFDAYLFASAKTGRLTPDGVRAETLAFTSLDAFIREFALCLGERDVAEIPDAAARRRALLDALRGRRALLIWDNLETLIKEERDGISELLSRLPGVNKAIITSRRRTGDRAVTIRLGRLSEGTAFDLMDAVAARRPRVRRALGRVGDDVRRALYEASGGNPLALHWTLGLVSQKGYSLERALTRLRDAVRSRDLYAFLFADAARDLEESDRKVLSALAYFQTPTRLTALAEAADLLRTEAEMALERLVTLSLVNDLEGGRYGLHPLTRTYVRAALGEGSAVTREALGGVTLDPEARWATLRYWVDYAQQYGGGSKNYQTFDRLEEEWPNLEAAADVLWEIRNQTLRNQVSERNLVSESARMLNDLADALRTFLWFRGYWDESVRLGTWAYEAMAGLEKWRDAGWRANDVAFIHGIYARDEPEKAAAWTARMAEAMEQGGNRRDRVIATRRRGDVAQQRGELEEAERLYTEVLEAARNQVSDRNLVSIVLNDLGSVARKQEAYGRAEGYYREALELDEEMGNKEYQATRCGNLGLLALYRGRPEEARAWFERELPLAREVGRQDLVATAQRGLARVLEEEGRYTEALCRAEEALEIRERLRHRDVESTRKLVARLREKV